MLKKELSWTIAMFAVVAVATFGLSAAAQPPTVSERTNLTLNDFSLFGITMHETEKEALKALREKSIPVVETTRCLSEMISDIKENRVLDSYPGKCTLRAASTVEVGPGEKKKYVVQFFERYRTEPGVMEVVGLEYTHGWDTRLIDSKIDPYEILKRRFGEYDRTISEYGGPEEYVWDFSFDGHSVVVVLMSNDGYFFPRTGSGYTIRIEYTMDVVSNWMHEMNEFAEKSVVRKDASKPDF